MSNIKLDLSQFKHKSSDKNSTTLVHEKHGHEITLAHKALSPENQKALKALGEAANKPSDKAESKQDNEKYGNITDSKGNKPQVFKDGGDVKPAGSKGFFDSIIDTTSKFHNDIVDPEAKKKPEHTDPADPLHEPKSQFAEGGDVSPEVQKMTSYDPKGPMPDPDASYQQAFTNLYAQNKASGMSEEMARSNALNHAIELKANQEADASNAKSDAENLAKEKDAKISQENDKFQAIGGNPLQAQSIPQTTDAAAVKQVAESQPGVAEQPAANKPIDNAIAEAKPAPPREMPEQDQLANDFYNKGQQAIQGAQATQEAQGQAEEKAYNAKIQASTDALAAYQQQGKALEAERQAHIADIKNGHIDPEQYWKGNPATGEGSHSKIASGIGMILSGFGGVKGVEATTNYLQYQMNQNIEAQAKNLQSDHNLLNANLQQFHNIRDAADMTRLQLSDVLQARLGQAASVAKTQGAASAALAAQSKLAQEAIPIQQNLQARRAMAQFANGSANGKDPSNTDAAEHLVGLMRMQNPELAKEMAGQIVHGVGVSSTGKQIPDNVRDQIIATKNVNNLFNESLKLAKVPVPKNPADLLKYRAQAETVHQQLVGSIKQAQHDGVYKPSEAEFLIGQIGGSPASMFSALSSVPKIKELQRIKQGEYNNLLSTYGLQPQALASQQAGPQYKTVGGVKYMRGPDGKAVPVK